MLLNFNCLHSGYCTVPPSANKIGIRVIGAGIGKRDNATNTTLYRAGVVNCPVGTTSEPEMYTHCGKDDGTLDVEDGFCKGKSCHCIYHLYYMFPLKML